MNAPYKNNILVRNFKKFLKNEFIRVPKGFHLDLIKAHPQILEANALIISKITCTDKAERFINFNKIRITWANEEYVITHCKNIILKKLQDIVESINNPNVNVSTTRESEYKSIKQVDEDIVLCREDTTYRDILLTLYNNPDTKFIFNDKIPILPLEFRSDVQCVELEIINTGAVDNIPIKYEILCTEKNNFNVECGNKVSFCEVHKFSRLSCTDTMIGVKAGHLIKNIEKVMPSEYKKVYIYSGKDVNDDGELLIYSFEEINTKIITANCLYIEQSGQKKLLLLCVDKSQKISELKYDILLKDTKNYTFLDDIFDSLKSYMKKEHKKIVSNQNRVIGKFIRFQLLSNIFFDKRFHSLIIGKSGSGKSFFSELLLPMFTFKYVVAPGTSITKNRLLGGQDKFKNFLPGLAITQNMVFLEEATNEINKFLDPKNFHKNESLLELLKMACGFEYDPGMQSATTVYPTASFVLVGNVEQLPLLVKRYVDAVAKQYVKFSDGRRYNKIWPISKPLAFYKIKLGDTELMRAHAFVREFVFTDSNYKTGLPEAEHSRFTIMINLEEDETLKKITEVDGGFRETPRLKKNLHRDKLIQELKKIFKSGVEIPKSFDIDIHNYYYNEYLQKPNNFTSFPGIEFNNHLKKSLLNFIYYFILMDKLYWNAPFELTEDDKNKVEHLLLYTQTSINTSESQGFKKPYVNDLSEVKDDDLFELNIKKSEDYRASLLQKDLREKEELKKDFKFDMEIDI